MTALTFTRGVLLFSIIFVAGECFFTEQHSVDSDGSDGSLCGSERFSCRTVKKCVSLDQKCDGTDDCGDHSDEENCQHQTADIKVKSVDSDDDSLCGSRYFSCSSVLKCVSKKVKCDGKDDCGDNSDEVNC